jgi:hypothetical protein
VSSGDGLFADRRGVGAAGQADIGRDSRPSVIRFSADLNLLSEARQLNEQLLDKFYLKTDVKKKRQAYRQKVRKNYVSIERNKRPAASR